MIYNSMSGEKEPLETLEPGKVRFYACGPTVYDLFHLGNARMFVVFDTARRYLEYRGYEVRFVQNFTDVDDRIIQRANETGKGVRTVASENIEAYFRDADALGIRRAVVHPRVTDCIPEIIAFVSDLIEAGHAYVRDGDVYFDTSTFPSYGKLSNQSVDDMRAGHRIEIKDIKDNPTDFALWKAAKPNEEFWDSPWGPGRPGWHIECSVMNLKYLGDQIDIHAGGRDLIFPHHENEIAQSEAHSGKQFARYWMHNGSLNINGEKMSKSLGNFVTARKLLEQRSARAVRCYLLSAHYRHPINYTDEAMDQVEQGLDRIDRCLRNIEHRKEHLRSLPEYLTRPSERHRNLDDVRQAIDGMKAAFVTFMDDDFNTADALSAIFEGVRLANTYVSEQHVSVEGLTLWKDAIIELLDVLGLATQPNAELNDADIERLIDERLEARRRRDFKRSDEIRDELSQKGIVIEDTPQGTRWYRK